MKNEEVFQTSHKRFEPLKPHQFVQMLFIVAFGNTKSNIKKLVNLLELL